MRKKPYTQRGIKRLCCVRCFGPAVHQWQVCADNNTYRPICAECDVELNKLVLQWMGDTLWDEKIATYRKHLLENS